MTTLYEGKPVGRRGWSILAGCCVVGFLLVFFGSGGLHDQSILVLAALLVVVIGGPFALMLFSKNFYGRVELTAEQLRVGRGRILVQDIWPRDAIDTTDTTRPSAVDRVGNSATAGTGETPTEQARMAGGAWAVPLGSDSVTIRVRGERVRQVSGTTGRAPRARPRGALSRAEPAERGRRAETRPSSAGPQLSTHRDLQIN